MQSTSNKVGFEMSAVVRGYIHRYAETKAREVVDSMLLEAIDLDRAVEHLAREGQITDLERTVLSAASYGHSVNMGARNLGISRWLYSRKLRGVCRKMSRFLGWEYSDRKVTDVVEQRLGRELNERETRSLKELYRIYVPSRSTGSIFND